jgi:hypothetical protein
LRRPGPFELVVCLASSDDPVRRWVRAGLGYFEELLRHQLFHCIAWRCPSTFLTTRRGYWMKRRCSLLAMEFRAVFDLRLIFCCCLDCVCRLVEESSTTGRGGRGLMLCLNLLSSSAEMSLCQSAVSKDVTSLSSSMDVVVEI